jgi:hypothetical protein
MNDYKWAFCIFALNFAGFSALSIIEYFATSDFTFLTEQIPLYLFSCVITAMIGLAIVKADKAMKKHKKARRGTDPFDQRDSEPEMPAGDAANRGGR